MRPANTPRPTRNLCSAESITGRGPSLSITGRGPSARPTRTVLCLQLSTAQAAAAAATAAADANYGHGHGWGQGVAGLRRRLLPCPQAAAHLARGKGFRTCFLHLAGGPATKVLPHSSRCMRARCLRAYCWPCFFAYARLLRTLAAKCAAACSLLPPHISEPQFLGAPCLASRWPQDRACSCSFMA